MISKVYLKILYFFIACIDFLNKKKIIKFFKLKFKDKKLVIIDVGAHKGETVDLFKNSFNIKKIYALEPNLNLFKKLISIKKFKDLNINFLNIGLGERNEEKNLNVLYDTSSSTFNKINSKSTYFKKKVRIFTLLSENKNFFINTLKCKIVETSLFISKNKLNSINILKIDTEGYELNVLLGLSSNDFKKIDYIYFEHHYDLMIKKKYKFKDIHKLLLDNNFKSAFKVKMPFRKTFEYIYERN